MKYTIEGFSQEYALTLQKEIIVKGKAKRIKVDCNDLVILRWFVDFYPKMMKVEIEGKQYAWIKYQALLEDLPLLDIKKRMLFDRLQKLVDFGILSHKSIKSGGSFSYYGFGDNYIKLVDDSFRTGMQKIADGQAEDCTGVGNKLQTDTQESAEQIDSSIKHTSNSNTSIINKGINNNDNPPQKTKKSKVKTIRENTIAFGKYENVHLKDDEFKRLVDEYKETIINRAIDILSDYIKFDKPDYEYKDHNRALRNWVITKAREIIVIETELAQREQRAKEIEAKQKENESKYTFNGKRLSELTQVEYEEYLKTQQQTKPKIKVYNWLEAKPSKDAKKHQYTEEEFANMYDDITKVNI